MPPSKLQRIDSEILSCTKCRLHEGRTHAVPGNGKKDSRLDLMLVGEAPGRNEDETGEPFVGRGGRILDSMLEKAGIERSEVYVTNIVKCRPPGNRKPENDEIEICTAIYLERQIEILKPKLICTLGATALKYFTGETNMRKNHGRIKRSRNGMMILPTYHPAAIFRNNSLRKFLQDDIKKVPLILEDLKNERGEDAEVEK